MQAAQFTGRKAELEQLITAYETAQAGHGGLWLVGGESGVGKSRLVDELRIIALTRGATVMSGQAIEAGSLPYQAWRDVLPSLLLNTPVDIQQAGILKEIVPQIDQLVGYPVPDAPALDGVARKTRLQVAFNQLFQQQTNPILVILDDLQWANASLDLLIGLQPLLTQMPILVIGTYRDDERPQLPDELHTQQVIHLRRFDTHEIEALSVAMLGNVGKQEKVVSLLNQETEGNIFFLIEVVRALAEEAGNLSLIGDKTLPDNIFTGGIETIVNRRLSKLPTTLAIITQLAAVIGREIDFDLLYHHYQADILNDWLIACVDAMILEIRDNKWRFAHDKLREGALRNMPKSLRKKLNKNAAHAIETVYPNNTNYNRALLEHWYVAGQIKKTVHYTIQVVNRDLNVTGTHQHTHALLDRALALLVGDGRERMNLYNLRAKAYGLASDYDQAMQFAQKANDLAHVYGDKNQVMQSLYTIGEVLARKGSLAESVGYLEQAVQLAEELGDDANIARCLNNLGVSKQRMGEFAVAKAYFERAKLLYIKLNDQHGVGLVTNYLGFAAITAQNRDEAVAHWHASLDILRKVGDLRSCGIVLGNLGGVYFDRTQYAQASDYYEQSLKIARDVGNHYGENIQIENLGRVYCSAGEYEKGMTYFEQALTMRRAKADRISIAYALNNIGIFASNKGDYERARVALEECLEHGNATGEKIIILSATNNLGFVYAFQGDVRAKDYFIDALKGAIAIDYTLAVQAGVLGMAWWHLHEGNPQKAGELVGLIQHIPNLIGYFHMRIGEIMPHLQRALPADELAQCLERGKEFDLMVVAGELVGV
ncbi:MAG: tetratricopeptide repeat protein [Anaerolineae bacterium]|nr:tetratricopeptide repeat protein [Anaerolineae bacterium]